MTGQLEFEVPRAWQFGLPLLLLASILAWRSLAQLGLPRGPRALLAGLRLAALAILILLVARPVWTQRESLAAEARSVAILIDQSASMSIESKTATRHAEVLNFVGKHLGPALEASGFEARFFSFAEGVQFSEWKTLLERPAQGRRTHLGAAIAHVVAAEPSPLAVIACTDGAATDSGKNQEAIAGLVEAGLPFIGIGFGDEQGASTLSLRRLEAPLAAPPMTEFQISVQLEMANAQGQEAFDLILYRDGAILERKTVRVEPGSRIWQESFRMTEGDEGQHQYTVQLLPPPGPGLRTVNRTGSATVQIREEKELRVLFVQGALTWDYKFIHLALKGDPSIKVTGLTRTSQQSLFRQNVETAEELKGGFPATLEEMAPFRVVVLSQLKPIDLTPAQQDLLARFCGELGGGVLMMGGAETFDYSWRESRLEKLLPVELSAMQTVQGLDRAFRIELTDDALQHPVFQIAEDRPARAVWAGLPAFAHYGRVGQAKPGAQVWAVHQFETGPHGRRILMATQRYGAGLSAVICLENLWRWRLAKEADPAQFDRFWKQFFRYLAESRRQEVIIHLADQELQPQRDIRFSLERPPSSTSVTEPEKAYRVRIQEGGQKVMREEALTLRPGRSVEMSFRAQSEGAYAIDVLDPNGLPAASRSIDIRDVNVEFQNTARNMEILRQWAALSGGVALPIEECRQPGELVAEIQRKIEQVRESRTWRRPLGVNAWTLAVLLGCLSAEWLLRKRYALR